MAETAELLVPELVTKAVRFSADRARTRWAGAGNTQKPPARAVLDTARAGPERAKRITE